MNTRLEDSLQRYESEKSAPPIARARNRVAIVSGMLLESLFLEYTTEFQKALADKLFWKTSPPSLLSRIHAFSIGFPGEVYSRIRYEPQSLITKRFWRESWKKSNVPHYNKLTNSVSIDSFGIPVYAHEATHFLAANTNSGFEDSVGAAAVEHYFAYLERGISPAKPVVTKKPVKSLAKAVVNLIFGGFAEHNFGFSGQGVDLADRAAYLESQTQVPLSGLYFIGQVCKGKPVTEAEREMLDPNSLVRIYVEGLAQKYAGVIEKIRTLSAFDRLTAEAKMFSEAQAYHTARNNLPWMKKCAAQVDRVMSSLGEISLRHEYPL